MKRYKIEVNDGCNWGKDEGYKTLKEAKKELKEIIKEDKEFGCIGMTYTIIEEVETENKTYYRQVYEINA